MGRVSDQNSAQNSDSGQRRRLVARRRNWQKPEKASLPTAWGGGEGHSPSLYLLTIAPPSRGGRPRRERRSGFVQVFNFLLRMFASRVQRGFPITNRVSWDWAAQLVNQY